MILEQLIEKYADDLLAEKEGMVYQVWSDGEITLTKSGSLLGQRNLHTIIPGSDELDKEIADKFPHQTSKGFGYMYTTKEGAWAIAKHLAPVESVQARMLAVQAPTVIEEINKRNTIYMEAQL